MGSARGEPNDRSRGRWASRRAVLGGLAVWSLGVALWQWSWVVGLAASFIGGAMLTVALTTLARVSSEARAPLWTVTVPVAISLTLLSWGVGRPEFVERATLTGLGTIGIIFVLLHILEERLDAERQLARHRFDDARRRLAGDVHDVVGHTLAASMLHTSAARLAIRSDPEAAIASLERSEAQTRRSMRDIRSIVHLLRDGNATETPVPMIEDLNRLVDDFGAAGATVTIETTGDLGDLGAPVALTLYRVVQEGLTNAARHGSGPVRIRIELRDGDLCVEIVNARHPNRGASHAGTGLIGLRERVEPLGGQVEWNACPEGDEWLLRVRMPA
ncbi:MAG: histidine kinase [Actinomycetota bacterium]|nr:histidine kinase [Actinomycetota bacterium]MDA3015584.1 histidine kinase [Actinomycetota bacterium]MDA3028451.1 histidine kinase [Actinomycetota bacterium]